MRLLTLLLVPAALLAAPSRFARLGDFQGQVEVQLTAADPWIPAERNLPLIELTWLRTGPNSRVEVELDDGSAWRLGPDTLGEISDYTQLSTGQRITLLALDHGTAYYSGQPLHKDVTMLVTPGAQVTVLQGSRVRQTTAPGWSQVAVLEGQVRFSSPAAELDIHEGSTARVEPSNPSRFFLYPEIAAESLDRWSEDRDKLQTAPASQAYVTARYGLTDLDSAGKWLPTDDLGLVWKPAVPDGWSPYQKGRWRYYAALGYTWVSDDSWGWVPYHNGRWARVEKVGWVWQPSVTGAFHPAEVYWMRGTNFTGWGPLAPGEQWGGVSAGEVPHGYTAGNTMYAVFQQDMPLIDGKGFAPPTAEQLKSAVFVPAPPSPTFLTARLDATRPTLQVGKTRITPSIPGVTFGDGAPCDTPSDLMTNPPADPQPPVPASDAGATPPPDGVYPVPPIVSAGIDAPIVINPPIHPDYSRRPGGSGQNGNGPLGSGGTAPGIPNPTGPGPSASRTGNVQQPVHEHPPAASSPTSTSSTTTTPPAAAPPAASPVNRPSGEPVHEHPPAAAPPSTPTAPSIPRIDPGKIDPGKTVDGKKLGFVASGEQDFYRRVLKDISPTKPDFTAALADLDAWGRSFPNTASLNDRLYFYIHVYNATGQPSKVLETAEPLVQAGVRGSFSDDQQVLQILVAASSSVQKLPKPTLKQIAVGQKAARELSEFLPIYFAPQRKPSSVRESDWSLMRMQIEAIAKDTLSRRKPGDLSVN